jgi:hypothetical protein
MSNREISFATLKDRVFRLSCEARLGDRTTEARRTRSKELLIKKFSDLCELGASVVNLLHRKPGIPKYKGS